MSRIIPLSSTDTATADRLAFAAWQFTRAVLWAEELLSPSQHKLALALIKEHIGYPAVTEQSFTGFCERILLAREQQLTGPSGYLGQPSVWLHPSCKVGYSQTKPRYDQLLQQRQEIPGYREAYSILAFGYYKYQYGQRRSTFCLCSKKLLRQKAYGLLNLLYRAVIYTKFSNH